MHGIHVSFELCIIHIQKRDSHVYVVHPILSYPIFWVGAAELIEQCPTSLKVPGHPRTTPHTHDAPNPTQTPAHTDKTTRRVSVQGWWHIPSAYVHPRAAAKLACMGSNEFKDKLMNDCTARKEAAQRAQAKMTHEPMRARTKTKQKQKQEMKAELTTRTRFHIRLG